MGNIFKLKVNADIDNNKCSSNCCDDSCIEKKYVIITRSAITAVLEVR